MAPNARHLAVVPALIEPRSLPDDEFDAIETELASLLHMCPGERTADALPPLAQCPDVHNRHGLDAASPSEYGLVSLPPWESLQTFEEWTDMADNTTDLPAVPWLEPRPPRRTPIELLEEAPPVTDLDEFDLPEVRLLPGDRPLEKVIRALGVVRD